MKVSASAIASAVLPTPPAEPRILHSLAAGVSQRAIHEAGWLMDRDRPRVVEPAESVPRPRLRLGAAFRFAIRARLAIREMAARPNQAGLPNHRRRRRLSRPECPSQTTVGCGACFAL